MKRREFIKQVGFGILGKAALASAPALLLPNNGFGATNNKLFIKVFLRGGMDSLSLLAPKTAAQYNLYSADRPGIKMTQSQLKALAHDPAGHNNNTKFGMHPSAVNMRALFNNGHAVFFHGAGSTNITRSHFTQMDIIEGGDSRVIKPSGYIFDALGGSAGNLHMVSMGGKVAASMRGIGSKAMAMASPESFSRVQGSSAFTSSTNKADRIVGMSTDKDGDCSAYGSGSMSDIFCKSALQTTTALNSVNNNISTIQNSKITGNYGTSSLGRGMKQAIRLASSNVNVKTVNVDFGGWDTHNNEGVIGGAFDNQVKTLDKVIRAAKDDLVRLGMWNNTVIMVMSEFGRTIAQNGTGGTDHGRGGAILVFGGNLNNPQRVIAPDWDLARKDIRDVRVMVDYRKVAGEILRDHLGVATNRIENQAFKNNGNKFSLTGLYNIIK